MPPDTPVLRVGVLRRDQHRPGLRFRRRLQPEGDGNLACVVLALLAEPKVVKHLHRVGPRRLEAAVPDDVSLFEPGAARLDFATRENPTEVELDGHGIFHRFPVA